MDDSFRREISSVIKKVEKIDAVLASKVLFILTVIDSDANIKNIRRSLSVVTSINLSQFLSDAFHYYHLKNWFYKFIQVVRNFMVFVPIFFTWLSLYFALDSYARYVRINDQSESFLYLWQTGVGGLLDKWFIFSNVALLDAGFVGAIILLTIIISSSEESSSEKALLIKAEIEKIIWELEGFLYEKYTALAISEGTLESVVIQLQSLIDSWQNRADDICNFLAAEHTRLEKYSELQASELLDLKQAVTTFYEVGRIIVDTTNNLQQQVGSWADVTITHSTALTQMSTHMETILGYTRLLQENGIVMNAKISDLAKMEISVLNDFRSSSSRFAETGGNINHELEHVSQTINNLGSEVTQTRAILSSLNFPSEAQFAKTSNTINYELEHVSQTINDLCSEVTQVRSIISSLNFPSGTSETVSVNNRTVELLESIDQKLSLTLKRNTNNHDHTLPTDSKAESTFYKAKNRGILEMIKSFWSEDGNKKDKAKRRDKNG